MSNTKTLEMIAERCKGEFSIGVIAPTRVGKSSFVSEFIKKKILPLVKDDFLKQKIVDELPQSSSGKDIMTVEPKFVPNNAININVGDVKMNVRLVDSVGYVIPNATGYFDDNGPKLVKTPWFDDPIPFKDAAEIGTKKIMTNHSTIGVVITSDGSFGEFSRSDYQTVEDQIITEMLELKKPFVIVVNSTNPEGEEALNLKKELEEKYNVSTLTTNVLKMEDEDIDKILLAALNEFEINELNLMLPSYISVLNDDNPIKANIMNELSEASKDYKKFKDVDKIKNALVDTKIFTDVKMDLVDAGSGVCNIILDLDDNYYQEIVNSFLGHELNDKSEFIALLQDYFTLKNKYGNVKDALDEVMATGYGISYPTINEMKLLEPEVTETSGRYGVKLKAIAPSIHMIRVDVESTFEPIIGSLEQSKMLIDSLVNDDELSHVWDKEIFGRKLSELVNDGIKTKINLVPDKAKIKLQESLQKIVNCGNGGLIAIIL